MSLKSVVQSLRGGDVALFPSKEREHATTNLQHTTQDATPDATRASEGQYLRGASCNTQCNIDATTIEKPRNKPSAFEGRFVASVWRCMVDGKSVIAIDPERMEIEDFATFLDRKFGAGRVTDLQPLRK